MKKDSPEPAVSIAAWGSHFLFDFNVKATLATGATHSVIARNAGQAQDFFAENAFAVYVRFAVFPFVFAQYEKVFDGFPKGAKALVFQSSFVDVARKHSEKRVA